MEKIIQITANGQGLFGLTNEGNVYRLEWDGWKKELGLTEKKEKLPKAHVHIPDEFNDNGPHL